METIFVCSTNSADFQGMELSKFLIHSKSIWDIDMLALIFTDSRQF